MTNVEKTGGSHLHLSLEEAEAAVLRDLLRQMSALLGEDVPASDAVLSRLFPKAYDSEADQQSFEGLVANELRQTKSTALRSVREQLSTDGAVDVVVQGSDIDAWLTVLTDLRLALGTRLNMTQEKMDSEIDPADPEAGALSVLHWLGWIQHSIIEEMT